MWDIDELKSVAAQLKDKAVDSRIIKKKYEKRFLLYRATCRLKLTNSDKKYNDLTKSIVNTVKVTLENKNSVKSGNAVVIIASVDDHFNYLEMMKERMQYLRDKDSMKEGHEHILKCLQDLLNVLYENLKTPVSLNEFIDILQNEKELNNVT
jgi:hypothetical protein